MGKQDIIQQLTDHFRRENIQKTIVLTDRNVDRLYADYFDGLSSVVCMDKLVVEAGEKNKNIDSANLVWNFLAEKQYDREVFLLNFGGGMITDLGGFVASTYKRGIRYANCPTTLLAMIDAAVGGKTGVNLPNLKNGIGTFYFPDIQLHSDTLFLSTLPKEELDSGFGELVKYALIGSHTMFMELLNLASPSNIKQEYVEFCISFKRKIVQEDPFDKGIRHILNFGHTIGHAMEKWSAKQNTPVPHGIAVAQGLYYESLLSAQLGRLPQQEWILIQKFLSDHFNIVKLTPTILEAWMPYMKNDKKNRNGAINFTLLDHIGHAIPDFQIAESDVFDLVT